MEAAGTVERKRAPRRQVTWSFVLSERFERTHADARRLLNAPVSEQDFAQGILEAGLRHLSDLCAVKARAERLVLSPDEVEVSERLQAIKEGRM